MIKIVLAIIYCKCAIVQVGDKPAYGLPVRYNTPSRAGDWIFDCSKCPQKDTVKFYKTNKGSRGGMVCGWTVRELDSIFYTKNKHYGLKKM